MTINLKYIFLINFLFLILSSSAQKKKEIKKYGVKTITSTKTIGTTVLKDEKLTYNSLGLLTEEIKYDELGNQSSILRYKYNIDEDVIEETEYDDKSVLVEKRVTKYNVLAQKIEERVTDKAGKQVKRFTYTYNAKGLRVEKKRTTLPMH